MPALDRFQGLTDVAVERPSSLGLADPLLKGEICGRKGELDQQAGPDVNSGIATHAFGDQFCRPLLVGGRAS